MDDRDDATYAPKSDLRKRGNRFKKRGISSEQIKRECLVCDQAFLAVNRFNRVCKQCTHNLNDREAYFEYAISRPKNIKRDT